MSTAVLRAEGGIHCALPQARQSSKSYGEIYVCDRRPPPGSYSPRTGEADPIVNSQAGRLSLQSEEGDLPSIFFDPEKVQHRLPDTRPVAADFGPLKQHA